MFELHQFKQKLTLSILSIFLLFYCQNTINPAPYIELTTELNNVLYQSVIFCIMVEILIVLNIFGRQLQVNENKLKQLASIDVLTKANNRDYFFAASEKHFIACKNNHRPFSLLLINIDNFRRVNELYGHKVGDYYLQYVTEKIKNICSESEVFGRLGGEEFIISMPERTIIEAKRLAKKINALFNSTAVIKSSDMRCSVSIGAITNSINVTDFSELIAYSDQALHRAKAKGPGRIEVYLAPV